MAVSYCFACFLIFATVCNIYAANEAPTTTTVNGAVLGQYLGDIAVFLAIPYAAPPVGNLRFQKPEDPANWTGILHCNNNYSRACMQSGVPNDSISEDCLYLNVFTPSLKNDAKLPVMVFVHGGGFLGGSASDNPPQGIASNMAARGVVVVTINYRLNSFGLFTTLTSEYPANVAMFDQTKSLEWVQRNIANFGGDPKRVTIFGESSGGWSVSFLSYSPVSQNYFTQVIIQSGTALSPHAMIGPRGNYDPSRDFAKQLGCITDAQWAAKNFSGLQQCFATKSSSQIMDADIAVPINDGYRPNWVPQIDGPGGFFPQSLDQLAAKRVRGTKVMIGTTKDEGIGAYLYCLIGFGGTCTMNDMTQATFDSSRDQITSYLDGQARADVNAILDYAYGSGYAPIAPDDHFTWLARSSQVGNDYWAMYPSRKEMLSWQSIDSTVHMYSFDFLSKNYPWAKYFPAVPHAMDVSFMFNITGPTPVNFTWIPDADDLTVINLFGTLWTNFAISGDPNYPVPTGQVNWTAATQNAEYYSITTNSSMQSEYHHLAFSTWGTLIPQILSGYSSPSSTITTTATENSSTQSHSAAASYIRVRLTCFPFVFIFAVIYLNL